MPLAEDVLGLDKHVQTVGTQDANQDGVHETGYVAGIVEGLWHGEDARPQRSLEQMHQRFEVSVVGDWKNVLNLFLELCNWVITSLDEAGFDEDVDHSYRPLSCRRSWLVTMAY